MQIFGEDPSYPATCDFSCQECDRADSHTSAERLYADAFYNVEGASGTTSNQKSSHVKVTHVMVCFMKAACTV